MAILDLSRSDSMRIGTNSTYGSERELNSAASPVAGEQATWRAVIMQALMDATSLSQKAENLNHKREALIWLRGNSEDFRIVCHHAGFDPEFVKMVAKRALARNCVWRIPPGSGERAFKTRAGELDALPTARR